MPAGTITVRARRCSHDPKQFLGQPIGMYHCDICGCMVVAGLEHGPCLPNLCPLLEADGSGEHPGEAYDQSLERLDAAMLGLIEVSEEELRRLIEDREKRQAQEDV